MSRSIRTTVCAAAKVVAQPLKFQLVTTAYQSEPYWIATQTLEVTTHDGHQCSIEFFLEEGCNALTAGEPVVMPAVPESEREQA